MCSSDLQVHNSKGDTPLHQAARKGLLEVARKLLECGAEVDSRNDHGSTPLLLASQYGHTSVVQLLLDHNADLDARNSYGDTPLHCAAIESQLEVARLLLELNVKVNQLNDEGSTPLHRASESEKEGSAVVVQFLLDHGADAQARNLRGKTASEIAHDLNQPEIEQLLSKNAAE